MREPRSLELRCGRWFFVVSNSSYSCEMIFELRWRSRGGELNWISRRVVSEMQIVYAEFDLAETVWCELEQHILAQMEA